VKSDIWTFADEYVEGRSVVWFASCTYVACPTPSTGEKQDRYVRIHVTSQLDRTNQLQINCSPVSCDDFEDLKSDTEKFSTVRENSLLHSVEFNTDMCVCACISMKHECGTLFVLRLLHLSLQKV
jgi:hypothetical protein